MSTAVYAVKPRYIYGKYESSSFELHKLRKQQCMQFINGKPTYIIFLCKYGSSCACSSLM